MNKSQIQKQMEINLSERRVDQLTKAFLSRAQGFVRSSAKEEDLMAKIEALDKEVATVDRTSIQTAQCRPRMPVCCLS